MLIFWFETEYYNYIFINLMSQSLRKFACCVVHTNTEGQYSYLDIHRMHLIFAYKGYGTLGEYILHPCSAVGLQHEALYACNGACEWKSQPMHSVHEVMWLRWRSPGVHCRDQKSKHFKYENTLLKVGLRLPPGPGILHKSLLDSLRGWGS